MRDNFPRPLVSVVIPCFNQARFLCEAVRSALSAYAGPLEVIVVDDGNTDPQAARHFREAADLSSKVTVIRQENTGPAGARNTGIRASSGAFLQFLDADDLLMRRKIDLQVDHLLQNPGLSGSFCNYYLCDEMRMSFPEHVDTIAPYALTLEDFLFQWEQGGLCIPPHCGLFRREIVEACFFDEELRAEEDWFFWVSILHRGATVGYLPLSLVAYRRHPAAMCYRRKELGLWFMRAAAKIDRKVRDRYPDFLEHACRWFIRCYQQFFQEEGGGREAGAEVGAAEGGENDAGADLLLQQTELECPVRRPATKISVVIPVYNHARYLPQCLLSIARQSAAPFEVICVDDASPDSRVKEILSAFAARLPRMKVISLPENRGISHALNLAVQEAKGEYVAFVDGDDYLAQDALRETSMAIEADPGCGYFFTDRYRIDDRGQVLCRDGYGVAHHVQSLEFSDALMLNMWATHLKTIRRDRYGALGGCDARYDSIQDWEYALRYAEEAGTFRHIDQPLYYYRTHRDAVSSASLVRQCRLTNVVRRRFQERRMPRHARFVRDAGAAASMVRALDVLAGKSAVSANPGERQESSWIAVEGSPLLFCTRPVDALELKKRWEEGKVLVYLLSGDAGVDVIGFLRWWNSFFDRIVCLSDRHFIALLGYLWEEGALEMAWDVVP